MRGFALALLLSLAPAAPALAVDMGKVTVVGDGLMDQFLHAPTPDVRDLLRNTTMLIKLGDIDPKLLTALPFGSDAVLFFAENGDLLAWSDKSAVVEAGYWEVIANAGFNEFCIRFGSFGLNSVCASPQIVARLNAELTAITRSPEIRQKLTRMGMEAIHSTPEGCRDYVRAELKKWGQVVKASGATLQ